MGFARKLWGLDWKCGIGVEMVGFAWGMWDLLGENVGFAGNFWSRKMQLLEENLGKYEMEMENSEFQLEKQSKLRAGV